MLYVDFTAGNKEYKLRLTTRNIVALEKVLGCNPVHIFGNGEAMPTITTFVQVLHASLQSYHHGINLDGAYDIFDEYIADGHSVTDFVYVIMDVYRCSGLIPKSSGDTIEKN